MICATQLDSKVQSTDRDIISSMNGRQVFGDPFAVDMQPAISIISAAPGSDHQAPFTGRELLGSGTLHRILVIHDKVQLVRADRLPPPLREREIAIAFVLPAQAHQGVTVRTQRPFWFYP